MRKKITHILDNFPTKSETFIVNQIIESINSGFQIKILANKKGGIENSSQKELLLKNKLYKDSTAISQKTYSSKFKKFLALISSLIKHPHYFLIFLKSLNSKKFGKKASSLKLWFQALLFLKEKKSDVFHAHFGICGITLSDLVEIGAVKSKTIVSMYGYDTFSTENDREEIKENYKLLFKNIDCIVVNSKYLKNNLLLLGCPEHKIEVKYLGVDTNLFKYKERSSSKVFNIITIGRFIKLKGQLFGIKVIKNLIDLGYEVQYTLIGFGEEYENLKREVKNLNLENHITIINSATQTEIVNLLHKHDLFLMTSITDTTGRAEGMGLVTLEAQATGLPIIGFKSGGVPETIIEGKTGFIVEEKDLDKMANKIKLLIDNKTLIAEMGINARNFVLKNFNNKIQTKNILKLYTTI